MKKQHIKALKEAYEDQKTALSVHKQRVDSGQIPRGTEFRFTADLQTLCLPALPVDILQKQIFEKLSVAGRPLSLATTIAQSVHSLGGSLEKRNELIAAYKAGNPPLSAELYFGLPRGGAVNQDYPSSVDAIYRQTDDGIFFNHLLCKDLNAHGKKLSETLTKLFRKGAPTIAEADFSKVAAGLMPDPKYYSDWLTAFKKKEDDSPKPPLIRRLLDRMR